MSLKKYDFVNLGAIIFTVIGVILEIIGCNLTEQGVGVTIVQHPLAYVGIAVIVLSLVVAVYGYHKADNLGSNKIIMNVALYLAEAAIVFAVLFMVMSIIMPLYNTVNG